MPRPPEGRPAPETTPAGVTVIAQRNCIAMVGARTLLRAPGLTTRNKKLLGAPGIATRSKKATNCIAMVPTMT